MNLSSLEGIAEKFSGIDFMGFFLEHGGLFYDILLAFLFLLVIIAFAKRGLVRIAAPFACLVLAFGTGISVANGFTNTITNRVYAGVLEGVTEQLQQLNLGEWDLAQIIEEGLPDAVSELLGVTARAALSRTVHLVILVVVTILSLIFYTVLSKLIEGAAGLPVIRLFDVLGGMVLGAAFCVVVFYLIVRILPHFGIDFFDRVSEGTVLLKWFTGA